MNSWFIWASENLEKLLEKDILLLSSLKAIKNCSFYISCKKTPENGLFPNVHQQNKTFYLIYKICNAEKD